MTPQELKNSILQLAIQGKLVEQRPEEGTAQELFAQIQAEKQRLIKAGRLKKEKPLPEITEDEKPFDIPESWMWVRVGDCGSWGSGATPSRTHLEYYDGTIPWLKTGDLNDGVITNVPEYITALALEKTSVRLNPIGSVLMAMYGATIGKLGILGIEATTNQACCACIPYEGLLNKFLFYYLMAARTTFVKMGEGGAQPNISKEKIVNTLFPLPPLAEQKRIVAKIEELLPYIDRYEQAWSKLEQFNSRFPEDMKKALLQYAIQGKLVEQRPEEGTGEELFAQIQAEKQRLIQAGKIKKEKPLPEITEDEKPFDIPDSWKWVRLGQIGLTNIGLTYSPKHISNDGIIVLRSSNIQNGKMNYSDIVRVNLDVPENKMCHQGDILICARNGSKRLVGKAALVDGDGMSFGAFMAIFKSQCNNYILYVINSAFFKNSMLGDTGTTTINQITQDMLKNIAVPLPPLSEQKRIVEKLEQLLPLCERLK